MGTDVLVLGDDQGYAASMANDYSLKPSSEKSSRESSRTHIQDVAAEVLSKENGAGKVFSIYGIGGLGKTFLMEELYSDFIHRFTHNTVVAKHSFEGEEITSEEKILKEISDLLAYNKVPSPSFRMNYYAWRAKASNFAVAKAEFCADLEQAGNKGIEIATLVSGLAAPFVDQFTSGIGGSVLDALIEIGAYAVNCYKNDKACKEWMSLTEEKSAGDLKRSLAASLKSDIEAWTSCKGRKLIFFMDTFEKLGWVAGEWRIGRYDWAKTITEAKGSLWIVAGRCRLAWKNVVRFPVQLEPMSLSEADALLVKCGVGDPELRSLATDKAKGIPVYLTMLADMINRSSKTDAKRDLLNIVSYESLVEVYLRGLDASLKPAIYTAAFIEYWDYDFMMAVGGSYIDPNAIAQLENLSFIWKRQDGFEMHEVVADLIRRSAKEPVVMRLFKTCGDFLERLAKDDTMAAYAKDTYRLHVLKARQLLAVDGAKALGPEASFDARMQYAEAAWHNGQVEQAYDLYEAIQRSYVPSGPEDQPSIYFLRAKLKTAALKTQLWLTRGERKWHEQAISDTVEVLDDVRKYYPGERLIYLSALNDLGISWKRFKDFDQAFFYQNQVVNALKDKKARDLDADEARFINNYGATCQQYGAKLKQEGRASEGQEYLKRALKYYDKAYKARKALFGTNSLQALIVLTNKGVANMMMGKYPEAENMLEKAYKGFKSGGFPTGDSSYLRARFQLANVSSNKARELKDAGLIDEARIEGRKALELHKKVYNDKKECLTEWAVDTGKSRDAVKAAERFLAEL